MSTKQNLLQFSVILVFIVIADYRNKQQTAQLGGYTKFVAEQVINNVGIMCNAPNV